MTNVRKRGKELESAILEAAFEICRNSGYQEMTFQNVAKKASTSRTVLYRQYRTQMNLLHEMAHYRISQVFGVPTLLELIQDRGSLREDLLDMVKLYHKFMADIGVEILGTVLIELSKQQDSLKEISAHAYEVNRHFMTRIQGFAKERGEVTSDFTSIQMQLPFNLMRYEFIIQGGHLSESWLASFVDEVLLPIYLNNKGPSR